MLVCIHLAYSIGSIISYSSLLISSVSSPHRTLIPSLFSPHALPLSPSLLPASPQRSTSAKVVYPKEGSHPAELSIKADDHITNIQWNVNDQWSRGTCKGRSGFFHSFCVREYDTHAENLQRLASLSKGRGEPSGYKGGFAEKEYTFKTRFEDHFLCAICQELARNATQSSCCGQSFCKACIESWQARANNCPICRKTAQQGFQVFDDVRVNRFILGLQLYCPNFDMGCNWEGELRGVKEHLAQICQYEQVDCPNGCDRTLRRYMVNAHLQRECTLRKQACVFCEQGMGIVSAIPYLQLTQSHYRECPYVPVMCPNDCGNWKVRRGTLADHLETSCPKQEVACDFSQFGCKFKATRKEMPEHLRIEVHTHLSLLMKSHCSLLQEVERLKATQ